MGSHKLAFYLILYACDLWLLSVVNYLVIFYEPHLCVCVICYLSLVKTKWTTCGIISKLNTCLDSYMLCLYLGQDMNMIVTLCILHLLVSL